MGYVVITSKELDKEIRGSLFGISRIETLDTKIVWHFHNKKFMDKAVKVLTETFEYVYVPSEV